MCTADVADQATQHAKTTLKRINTKTGFADPLMLSVDPYMNYKTYVEKKGSGSSSATDATVDETDPNADALAAAKAASLANARQLSTQSRGATILTGAKGDVTSNVRRKTLLGV